MNSARAVRMRRRRTTMIVVTAMIRNVSRDTLQTLAVAEGDQVVVLLPQHHDLAHRATRTRGGEDSRRWASR